MVLNRAASLLLALAAAASAAPRFEVRFAKEARSAAVDGRLVLVVAAKPQPEPRFQVSWGLNTAQIFGIDVEGLQPDQPVLIDSSSVGHPLASLSELKPGTYSVQAVLNVYETVKRADGRVLKLPWDDGEGQQWNRSPGNLISKTAEVRIDKDSTHTIVLDAVIPPVPEPMDTKWVRHVKYESKLLSDFWGRPVRLGAIVLVPPGFDVNPEKRYPVAFQQGHFPRGFRAFSESPPSRFFQEWTSGRLPKFLIVLTQHATPFYDDSYGVNTANNGPYGDALTKEFYPWLEQRFRAIGEPWARVLYGGSTGGWMSLAQQIFYPDFFGGTWSFCPDPVDFSAFQLINVYSDTNAHYDTGTFSRLPKLLGRLPDGRALATNEGFTRQELVLGTKGRSGGQLDAFHSVFGPVGKDGYPAKLWDPLTGDIDKDVARYWIERYDLTAILKKNWESLGPRLVGKIHITMGTKDTFFLDTATRRLEEFLESTRLPRQGPYYGGSVIYGNDKPHCWAGDIPRGMTTEEYYLPIFAEHIRRLAPQGADTRSWMP